ncbi:MAG: DNA polymerase III subunit alpha [Spirochaetales bacterium]|nr:DNA polymerase III subunit alpha [Spirochaetales bacterium]
MPEFVHLHTHSDFSLLDGAATVGRLVAKAKQMRMPALALTDHGNMFGALRFYLECRKEEINPIIGSEVYLAPESRLLKSGGEKGARYHHLVLLARDVEGYRNLLELASRAYTEGFYYKPRIDDELLEEHHRGLIALSGCMAGEIPRLVVDGALEQAEAKAVRYRELFGPDSFYLEIQDQGIPEQKKIVDGLTEISRRTGIPLVATNDVHYVEREDAYAQDVLICIGTGKKLNDGRRLKFEYPEFYFKNPQQMAELFSGLPDALANTVRIAEQCNLSIPLPGPLLPHYEVPAGYTLETYLSEIARRGLQERYPQLSPEVLQRLEYELSVIGSMGYTGYFLIVWDFIRFARENGIPVGPGRGSGAGSLVAYSLKITDIDPLKYGLLFERFLNPERVSMPDFDIDFCFEGRGAVIDYVIRKYGSQRVGQIITFGTLKARAVIRDVARVLDLPYNEADAIAKQVPMGPKVTLAGALKQDAELAQIASRGEVYRQLMEVSLKLEGLHRHASTHAAGIVIGQEDLTHYVPLYRDPKTGAVSTQYTMDYLEDLGLVKMDFLGLKTLTVIKNTLGLLRRRGIELDLQEVPEDDAATFRLLGQGHSTCIFQFESQGMQDVLKRARPESIPDLIALNALYRPGPMEFIDQFCESKSGRTPIVYPLPELEPILKETYGVIVYQEQVMEIARQVAGFSLGEADILRRAMGKKKPEVMAKQKVKFLKGAAAKGYDGKTAERIFELLVPFAGYGFNKSHAAAYSLLAYQTAYLKANYPAEFMAANLTGEINSTDKLAEYIGEARTMEIEILPPDINISEPDFTVLEGRIVYGLTGIKNVGSAAVEQIVEERKAGGEYTGLVDFLIRNDLKTVNRKVVETLILCGVFDRFGDGRATLLHNLDRVLELVGRVKESRRYGQTSLFDGLEEDQGVPVALEPVEEWPALELLNHERQNLGFYFSGHPLDRYRGVIHSQVGVELGRLEGVSTERLFTVVGILKDLKEITTKAGRRMAFAVLEDYSGAVELVVFADVFERSRQLLEAGRVVAVRGRIDRSRGPAKIKVEQLLEPEGLSETAARTIHLKMRDGDAEEELFLRLRDSMVDSPGECPVFFHLPGTNGQAEIVIKASPHIRVAAEAAVLKGFRESPLVEDVWSE